MTHMSRAKTNRSFWNAFIRSKGSKAKIWINLTFSLFCLLSCGIFSLFHYCCRSLSFLYLCVSLLFLRLVYSFSFSCALLYVIAFTYTFLSFYYDSYSLPRPILFFHFEWYHIFSFFVCCVISLCRLLPTSSLCCSRVNPFQLKNKNKVSQELRL